MGTIMNSTNEFIFKDCAGLRDNLEKAIVYTMRQNNIDNEAKLVNIRSSGAFLIGTKKQCLRIRIDKTAFITVSCIDVGTFLYVSVFREEKLGMFANARREITAEDVFKQQQQNAVYSAILACCEIAFGLLSITDKKVKFDMNS